METKLLMLGLVMAAMMTTGFANVQTKNVSPAKEENVVKITFVGDCTLGSFKGSSNNFAKYYQENGADYFFNGVKSVFASDDITFVNLEGPLTSHSQELVKEFSMRGEPEYIDILKNGSVEIANLANNHTRDCGTIGLTDTVNLLQTNGIHCVGEDYVSGYVVDGITVYCLGYKGWNADTTLMNNIAEDIKVCREVYGADIVCVEFHWGTEREYVHNKTQETLAHWTIDNGADVVVGAHPHVLQDTEVYNGKLIAYSLGNFCFGGNSNPKDKDTAILSMRFTKDGNYTYEFIPCSVSSVTTTNDYQPTIVTDETVVARIKGKLKIQ